jgi:tetratricopeptide (TPR) repeat protein
VAGGSAFRAAGAVLLAALALACLRPALASEDPWDRALRKRGVDPALLPNPIAITPEIEAATREYVGGGGGQIDQLRRIQSALFDTSKFTFVYDPGATYSAAEAMRERRGNCVAITNLFVTMARAAGIRVKAGLITPHSVGEKRGDLVYVAAHVVAVFYNFHEYVVFDFYRMREDPNMKIRLLDDLELAALYLNNRAVDSLSREDYARAEEEFEAVVRLAPDFAPGLGNLGVVRRRRGNIDGALDAYRRALEIDPRNPSILGNLAALYTAIGREREAKAALALADLNLATPYTILARGDLEAADGHVDEARKLYRKAARAGPRLPEPQMALARLERSAGRPSEARRAAQRAARLAPDSAEARALLDEIESVAPSN